MLTPDYIVGLVDGEGSFTVYIRDPDKTVKLKRRVVAEPKFYVKLVEHDKSVLYELQRFFGCGNVYFQKDRRGNHQHCYRYEVGKREDLEKVVIPFFRKSLLRFPSKKRDFKIFCDLFSRIKAGEHLTQDGLRNLYQIKQCMH
jgi:hypothetical protein